MNTAGRIITMEMALIKARKYCDKAERAHADVRRKLVNWGVGFKDREHIIGVLISEDLLNESRYASAFVNDKFRFNKWGIARIKSALKSKGVSDRNIADALKRIDPRAYKLELKELATKKLASIKGDSKRVKSQKTAQYLIRRGYEPSLVWTILQMGTEDSDDIGC